MTWDEHIRGRQFDVVIRFHFQFYDYLVLVECKDVKRPISSEKVEAFVIKSKDAGANKSIMVSASGFQSGAKVVAKKHNIELFTLKEIKCKPNNLVAEMLIPLVQVSPLVLFGETTMKLGIFLEMLNDYPVRLTIFTLVNSMAL